MELRKLANVFYDENRHLVEVLDKSAGQWDGAKTRGYGIVVIQAGELRFGIPLRSKINHKKAFLTTTDSTKGLDYSKAVLLVKDEYILNEPFNIPNAEYLAIKQKSHTITQEFTKYVEHYKKGIRNADENILRSYRFSTLQNYHEELGLE